jgi:hypothetical protein
MTGIKFMNERDKTATVFGDFHQRICLRLFSAQLLKGLSNDSLGGVKVASNDLSAAK